jgi:hypothetical protein
MRSSLKFSSTSAEAAFAAAPCNCLDCARIRKSDRSQLIARLAMERGMGVTFAPRERKTPQQMEAQAERVRRNRRNFAERASVPTMEGGLSDGER